MATKTQTRKLTSPRDLAADTRILSYTPSKSINEAAGLLRDRYADLKRHYRKIRQEWPSYAKRK